MVKSKVKYIQSLSHKKLRDEEGVFVAEGPKLLQELLHAPGMEAVEVFGLKEWLDAWSGDPLPSFTEIDKPTLEKLSMLATPNMVLGIFRKPAYTRADADIILKGQVSLMLDSIQDPGNMGTIVRCADWFGIRQVICSRDSADVFGPKTVQSTMGSIARVKVAYTDLETLLRSDSAFPVYAATLNGQNMYDHQPLREGAILIGNESKGIDPRILELVKHRVTIPRLGQAESLNAAVATGILLSHLVRG